MNDAFGQPVVIGKLYKIHSGGAMEKSSTQLTGVAAKVLNGKNGQKITLKLTRYESFDYDARLNEPHFTSSEMEDGQLSVYPHFLFPVPVQCGEDRRRVGDSDFESWFQGQGNCGPHKQLVRDAYAAGMSDSTPQP